MALMSEKRGQSEREAESKLRQHGENILKGQRPKSPVALFLSQFKDILILILAAATLFSVLAGQMTEAVTIISIMLLNAVMGFIQEYRTEKTLQSLKNMTAPVARVWREGKKQTLPAALVAVDDVIELRAGDRVPADADLIECADFRTDESILSGESNAVEKGIAPTNRAVFMGTGVLSGHGWARVTKTGMSTEMGKIAGMLSEVKEEQTPLQKKLVSLGNFVAVSCLACGAVVVVLGLARGEDLLQMLLTGISLAVAAIPEGLPAIVTIVLALSVNRILARGAIIRRLHAVETLGSATVICSDKTGTITENRMSVTELWCDGKHYLLTGDATSRRGDLLLDGKKTDARSGETLRAALVCAALCGTATIEPDGKDKWTLSGSPTETALLVAAAKCGVDRAELLKTFAVVDEKPFDSVRKMMSVQAVRGGKSITLTKGAPDEVLRKCTHIGSESGIRPMSHADRMRIVAEVERMANNAERVLAVATRQGAFAESELVFLGLFGMKDPPRREVKRAVAQCRRAGIRPIMITGDHALTACAIAREVGIAAPGDQAVEGRQIEKMSEAELRETVKNTGVFARVSPHHKLRIVEALRKNGNIVAMTGDGVNDAPAVKQADIGVAMGISGSDVTKEASSVVILDDNFATIVAAVEEGRIIYQNIKRFIRFLLTSNLGEVMTVVLAMALGMPVIFIPIQILLINLVTDGLPAVALGMEPAAEDIMERPPRDPNEGLFAHGLAVSIVFRGVVLGLCNLLSFAAVYRMSGGGLTVARSASYMTLIFAQMLYVLECRADSHVFIHPGKLFSNKTLLFACVLSIAVTLAVVYIPALQSIFALSAVRGELLLPVLGCTLISPLMGVFDRRKNTKR